MAKGKMTKGKMGKGEMAKIGGEMAKGEVGKGEMGINPNALIGYFQQIFFLRARSTTPLKFFYGRFRALARSHLFPDLYCMHLIVS
jgi:hypothetical protein